MSDPCSDGECMCSPARTAAWRGISAEEIADAITCLCVEKGGVCDIDPCKCRNQDVAEEGAW